MPPFVPWSRFLPWFGARWEQGDHIAAVGMTKSGKTVAMTRLLRYRDYVSVIGTKPRDRELYPPLERQGYWLTEEWNPVDLEHPRVILAPMLDVEGGSGPAFDRQADIFDSALLTVYRVGAWCLYFDELRYLSQQLGLTDTLDLLWLQGRSLDVSIVAATQRPRSVPLNMFEMARHFFLWRIGDREDRRRASEFLGDMQAVADFATARLARHEFLYVDPIDGLAYRSRVQL